MGSCSGFLIDYAWMSKYLLCDVALHDGWESSHVGLQSDLFWAMWLCIRKSIILRWFISIALRIPTAHDFYIISVRKLVRARTQRKKFPTS